LGYKFINFTADESQVTTLAGSSSGLFDITSVGFMLNEGDFVSFLEGS
jgi:hypothetical protein